MSAVNSFGGHLPSLSSRLVIGWRYFNELDVLSLGRDTAINLGVSYDKVVKTMLILSSVLIAVSTALVGSNHIFRFDCCEFVLSVFQNV